MILLALYTLKQFGEVVIVWIKKIVSSLYMSIFVRMIISALICLGVLFALIMFSNSYVEKQNIKFIERQQDEINTLVEYIEKIIAEENLTFSEANARTFVDEQSLFDVYFLGVSNKLHFKEVDNIDDIDFYSNQYIFEVSFSDLDGIVLINSNRVELTANLLYFTSAVLAILLFFALSYYLIFKQLSYITTIEQGINSITKGDILNKIPIKGKNELARLAVDINNMGDSLYKKMQKEREDEIARRLLITNMSHDLRTPLTSINGYIGLAISSLSPDHEAYSYISVAKENGLRLEKLINDLFLYSKLISGDVPVNIQSININVMLRQIIEMKTENIVFKCKEENIFANIDPEKFYRIIDNLISNASKYGVENEAIAISSHIDGDNAVVKVENLTEGDIDINVDLLSKRLYTAHGDRAKGSTGLGLSIVTELLKTMNSTLKLSYEDNVFMAIIKFPKP